MIDLLFQITLNNIGISFLLAIMAAIAGITLKRPSITYLMWLLVFVKLLTPPILTIPAIPVPWMDDITPPVSLDIDEQQKVQSLGVSESAGNPFVSEENEPVALEQGKHWLFIVWVLGSMVVFFWSMFQVYRFHQLLEKESETGSPKIQSIAKEIGSCLGIKIVPTIHTTSANISPMVWWIGGKVWVVIPSVFIEKMDAEKLRWILSHELAHVRRRDYMTRWIEWLACVCFWWNPVTWWARYNLRVNEELCCDALVLSSMKPKPYIYGDSLLKAIEILAYPAQRPLVIASGINNGNFLKRRVKMIVSNSLSKSTLRWLQTCILLGALMVLPLGLTKAQNSGDVNQESVESTISEVHETHPQAITSELEKHQRFPLVFDEIRQFVEIDDIWVISVDWSENHLIIKGTARSNVVVADFIRNMESSSLFQNVKLRNIRVRQSGTQEVSDFHITAMLNSYSEAPVEFLSQELLQKFLPLKRDIPLLLHQITASLSDAGLDVRVFEPGAVIPKDGYSETPIQIEVTGKYKNIMTTIGAIKRIERFVTFRDIELNSDEKDAVARMSMTIVAYHRNTSLGFQ